jgi:hypothetical protein
LFLFFNKMLSYGLDISFIHSYLIQKSCQNTCYFVNLIMFILSLKLRLDYVKYRVPAGQGWLLLLNHTAVFSQITPFFIYARLETVRIMWLGMAGGRPHRFMHNNFSSVYRIFTKLGHMIPPWKGKNLIYFGVRGQGHHCYK